MSCPDVPLTVLLAIRSSAHRATINGLRPQNSTQVSSSGNEPQGATSYEGEGDDGLIDEAICKHRPSSARHPTETHEHAPVMSSGSFLSVHSSTIPRVDIQGLTLVEDEEMAQRQHEYIISNEAATRRPFQVVKARECPDYPEIPGHVWKVAEQPRETIRAGEHIYVQLEKSNGSRANFAEAFTVIAGNPTSLGRRARIQLESSEGVHTPVNMILHADWFDGDQVPAAVDNALRRFWARMNCCGEGASE